MARLFQLHRDVDHSGVSGTGIVAEGVEFANDVCVVQWLGEHASTVVWPSIEHLVAVNGHGGSTRVVWLE
jgi:hypothetical protein